MNNRFLKIYSIAAFAVLAIGCSEDNSTFTTPNTDVVTNSGAISQANFSVLAEDLNPPIFPDPASNTWVATTVKITVEIGDKDNRVLTDEHTIFFRTEWGLIESSCVTENGECSVDWKTSDGNSAPADRKNTITAYAVGEESFIDTNGNSVFDDADTTFTDREEPFVDSNRNGVYDSGEPIIDVINGNDPTGVNGAHDIGDTFYNGTSCTHSSLCSTTQKSIYVWGDVQLTMDAPVTPPL